MKTSSFFRQSVFLDQSPAAAEYFEDRSSSLFCAERSQSRIEVYCSLSKTRQSQVDGTDALRVASVASHGGTEKYGSPSDIDMELQHRPANKHENMTADLVLSTALDSSGVRFAKISDEQRLRKFVAVSLFVWRFHMSLIRRVRRCQKDLLDYCELCTHTMSGLRS